MIFDDTKCSLGEGPLWHPGRDSLLWFDINNMRMYERETARSEAKIWQFDEHVSAAGWLNEQRIILASETGLYEFNLETCEKSIITPLESENPTTRSNDGRADPKGGFWIGTMGKGAEDGAGAIYRFYRGELRKLFDNITISNSICFAPLGDTAYFCDTPTKKIMRIALDDEGWPRHVPELFADVAPFNPDGAIVDCDGNIWSAQWGASRVARYTPQGQFIDAIHFPASQISCPAFGGANMSRLFATSAKENLTDPKKDDGCTFAIDTKFRGQVENRVRLD